MRRYPLLVFISLLLVGITLAQPTAYFVSPTPSSGVLTNQTLLVSFNFSPSNISSCKVQIQGVNYTGTANGTVCNYTYTLPIYTNVSVLGWATVSNSTFVYQTLSNSCNFTNNSISYWLNPTNFCDHDWTTYATAHYQDSNLPSAYINFSIPAGVSPASLFFAQSAFYYTPPWNYTLTNVSNNIPTSCLNTTTLQIRMDIGGGGTYPPSYDYCFNSSSQWQLMGGGSTNNYYYENAVNWSINTTNTTITYPTNETRTYCYGNCTSTTPPTITLISPANNNYTNNPNATFAFSASDVGGGNLSCSLYVDGMGPPQTNTSVQENTTTYFTETGIAQGQHYWNINCTDKFNNSAVSSTYYFTVITTPPTVALVYPANNAIFNASTFNFSFVAASAYSPTLSCYLFIDGAIAGSGTVPANATTSLPAPYLAGTHNWQVYCGDLAGNTNSSPIWNFAITQVIQPVLPPNNSIVSGSNVNLRYSFYTANPTNMTCAVYVDSTLVSNTTVAVPGGLTTQNLWVPADNGTHTWDVICVDDNTNGTIVMPASNFTIGAGIWGDVTYSLTPGVNFVNQSTNVVFLIASNLSKLGYYAMNITYYNTSTGNTTQAFFQNVSNAPGGGTLQYTMNYNGTYHIVVFFSESGQAFMMPWVIQFGNNEGLNNVAIELQANPPISGFGWYFIALCVAVIVAGFVSRYTVSGAGLAALGVLWIFSLLYAGVPVLQIGMVPLDGIAITTLATVMVFAGLFLGWYG